MARFSPAEVIVIVIASLTYFLPNSTGMEKGFWFFLALAVGMFFVAVWRGKELAEARRVAQAAAASHREAADASSLEYGQVRAATRQDDNILLSNLIANAERSIDMLFVTGRNTIDNHSDEMARAIERGVTCRLLLFDESSPQLTAMAELLKGLEDVRTTETRLGVDLSETMKRIEQLRQMTMRSDANASSRLVVKRYGELVAFDTVIVDAKVVWFHPILPIYEQCFPSFELHPPAGSVYRQKMVGLFGDMFNRGR